MKLSVVIPCYNEEKDIQNKTLMVLNKLDSLNISYEVILVNDGSKDNTKEVINNINGVKAISYDKNKGKGGAIKEGIKVSNGDYILFMDADLSTDLNAIDIFLKEIKNSDFVIGSRHHKDSKILIKQPLKRRFIGHCCRKIVNFNFKMKFSDTQCGFKGFKNNIGKFLIEKQTLDGFAFDVEYLYISKLKNFKIIEMPIIWKDDCSSTVSPLKSSLTFFKDIKRIKKNEKYYLS